MMKQMWFSFTIREQHLSVLHNCFHDIFMCLNLNFYWKKTFCPWLTASSRQGCRDATRSQGVSA